MLDFRALTDEQLGAAEAIFNEFRDKELKPAYLADADPNRALLDRRVVCDLLGFDHATYEAVRRLVRQVVRRAVGARRQSASAWRGAGGVRRAGEGSARSLILSPKAESDSCSDLLECS